MKLRTYAIPAIILVILISGCSLPTEPDPTTNPGYNTAVIPPTTKVVTQEEAADEILAISEDGNITLTEGSGLSGRVEVGDVIVSDLCDLAPDGFLRKITEIRQENGQTVLATRQAALTEAIRSCTVEDSVVITRAMVDSLWLADGVTLQSGKDVSTSFNLDLDLILFDADGSFQTETDRITVSGTAEFTAKIDWDMEIDNWKLEEFEFALERKMDLSVDLNVAAGFEWPLVEKKIAEFTMSNYIIMVGIVPITFQPKIEVKLKCAIDGSVQVSYGYSLVETTRNGSRYIHGQWENIDEKSKETNTGGMEVLGELRAKLSFGTRNSVKVYGLVGPYIEGMGFVQATAAATASQEGLEIEAQIEAGADVSLGFFMEFLSHTFFDFNAEWEIYRNVIWENQWHHDFSGRITLLVTPEELNAPWTVTGPDEEWSGTGSSELAHLPSGQYTLAWEQLEGWITPDPAWIQFNLAEQESLFFTGGYVQDGPGSIVGEIRDAVTYEVIPGASIQYHDLTGTLIAQSSADDQGEYEFPDVLAGTYRVIAEAPGYESNTAANLQVVDVEGNIVRADFALPPVASSQRFASFCGRTFDENGVPMSGVHISLSGGIQTNGVFRSTISSADGTYSISGIVMDDNNGNPIEVFTISVGMNGYEGQEQEIVLIQNEVLTNVDFFLSPWSQDTVYFSDGFEGSIAWTMDGFWNHNTLQGITNSAYPTYVCLAPNDTSEGALPNPSEGQYAVWYGRSEDGNFLGTQNSSDTSESGGTSTVPNEGTLLSPAFLIPAGSPSAGLTYDTWFEIESVNPNANGFDIMSVAVRDLTTGNTVELGRLNPVVDPTLPNRRPIPFTSGGFNVAPEWRTAEADLSAFIGHTIRLEFHFSTVDNLYNGFRGWIIDNIRVAPNAPGLKSGNRLVHRPGDRTTTPRR